MKLADVHDDTPLIVILVRNLLSKKEKVVLIGSDGEARELIFVVQTDLDQKWIFRGTTTAAHRRPITQDLRLPANAKIDHLLDLKKTDTHWELVPNWKRIKELGYQ